MQNKVEYRHFGRIAVKVEPAGRCELKIPAPFFLSTAHTLFVAPGMVLMGLVALAILFKGEWITFLVVAGLLTFIFGFPYFVVLSIYGNEHLTFDNGMLTLERRFPFHRHHWAFRISEDSRFRVLRDTALPKAYAIENLHSKLPAFIAFLASYLQTMLTTFTLLTTFGYGVICIEAQLADGKTAFAWAMSRGDVEALLEYLDRHEILQPGLKIEALDTFR